MNIKSYSELVLLPTFEDRFEYLRLDGIVGETTFGFDRYRTRSFTGRWNGRRSETR